MKMKKLPIGESSLKSIITGDFVYVDKTKIIYELLTSSKYFFSPALADLVNHS